MELRDAAKLLGLQVQGRDDADLLQALKARLTQREVPPGYLRQLLRDAQRLEPIHLGVDHIRFEAQITAAGAIGTKAESVSIPAGYDFLLTHARGYIQETVNESSNNRLTQNWARILFNAQMDGTNRNVFTSALSFAELINTDGSPHDLTWSGGVAKFPSRASLVPEFSFKTSSDGPGAWDTWAAAKVVGVVFLGFLVSEGTLP